MVDARDSKSRVRKGMSVRVRPRPPNLMPAFQSSLLTWYRKHKRDLPWRKSRDPYRILISEIMLQQTQVQTVIPYYNRWVKVFPTFQALAKAPLNRVLKQWEGLGYYSRARNLHALAKAVMKHHGGRLPATSKDLRELPGIGRYTAGAILSIAFNQPAPLIDGNVSRVLTRVYAIQKNIALATTQQELWTLAGTLVPKNHPGDFNQALMELGATVCTPRNPSCVRCPWRPHCQARKRNLQEQLPIKTKRAAVPHYHIGAGVIWHKDRILISQRPLKGLLGGLWEFPGGKNESGESLPNTVRREIEEELGIHVAVGRKIAAIDHAYSHYTITLHAYGCTYVSGVPQALGVHRFRWVRPSQLKQFAFPAANHPILTWLQTHGSSGIPQEDPLKTKREAVPR
jgi:A/G-specific adenine glycosylase